MAHLSDDSGRTPQYQDTKVYGPSYEALAAAYAKVSSCYRFSCSGATTASCSSATAIEDYFSSNCEMEDGVLHLLFCAKQ